MKNKEPKKGNSDKRTPGAPGEMGTTGKNGGGMKMRDKEEEKKRQEENKKHNAT